MPPFPDYYRYPSSFQRNLFFLHCLDFHAEDRLTPRCHMGQPCGKASWESPVGKPRGKTADHLIDVRGSVTLQLQLGRKANVHAPTRAEGSLPWGNSRSIPRSMSALERNHQVPARLHKRSYAPESTGEGSREAPNNSHGDWTFLKPPERVPEVSVVSREHLPQLEKIKEVVHSRRDETHFH